VDQTTALEEGALAMNAAAIVLVALAYVDDAALCCVSKSWFDPDELPFEVFYCCHPGGVFCSISISGQPPHGPGPSPLKIDQESPEIGFSTLGLILHEPVVGVLTADCQFHGPWNAEVAWGLENDAAGLQGAVAGAEEREVSKYVLIGSEGVIG
jgi:hypothetical protein